MTEKEALLKLIDILMSSDTEYNYEEPSHFHAMFDESDRKALVDIYDALTE